MTEEEYISQRFAGRLLNPRMDSTFKALFTQPTQESRGALHSFLEAATERKIDSFRLSANDAPENFFGQRRVSYDILCKFNDGLSADIEMQAFDQTYDYGKRAEYQASRLETTYLKKGDTWEKAPIVFQITVLDFCYKDSSQVVSRYAMRTKDGQELSNSLNVVFVDLTKAKELENTLEKNSALENWAIFLKNADNPKKAQIIKKLADKEEGLMQAAKSLSAISENRDMWIAQYRQEIAERDYKSSMSAALSNGIAQGITQGIAQGKISSARAMLADGVPISQIVKWTGLSEAEISSL